MSAEARQIKGAAVIRAAVAWATTDALLDALAGVETEEAQRTYDNAMDAVYNHLLPALRQATDEWLECVAPPPNCVPSPPEPQEARLLAGRFLLEEQLRSTTNEGEQSVLSAILAAVNRSLADDRVKRYPNAPRGEDSPVAKLTEAEARAIRDAPASLSQRALAQQYGVSQPTISNVRNGSTWGHLGVAPALSPDPTREEN